MFRILPADATDCVEVTIDGQAVTVPGNISVAAAVLTQGLGHTRTTPISASPRAPLCMMGVCYECLMVIDGQPNRRACQETVRAGMVIQRQLGVGPAS